MTTMVAPAALPARPRLLILTDYRGFFWYSTRRPDASMNIETLTTMISSRGIEPVVQPFSSIDFRRTSYGGDFVLYQSTHDRDLRYHGFIEDILLGLQLQGATLIPRFECFRAHHNKVFMEILRDLSTLATIKSPASRVFGTFEEFEAGLDGTVALPCVLKSSAGTHGEGVALATSPRRARSLARRLSASRHLVDGLKDRAKRLLRDWHVPHSGHRNKFVIQEFIAGLAGDFKIVVYGRKYYVLERLNRSGDFRASGSGRFHFPENPPHSILSVSEDVLASFDVPFLSLDIGLRWGEPVVLEFQFVSFGNYTIENAPFHFERHGRDWTRVDGRSDLEEEFANSVVDYILMRSSSGH